METGKKKLEYWLENVFWFHYKWYYLIGLFVLVVLICWIVTSATKVSYDWTVVYAHTGEADPKTLSETAELYSTVAGDVDGNGHVRVKAVEILLNDTVEHPLYGPLMDSDFVVFFMDGDTAQSYAELGYFEELSGGEKTFYVSSLDLYAAMNDAPYKEHYNYENEYTVYSEAEMADLNKILSEEHDEAVAAAKTALEALDSSEEAN